MKPEIVDPTEISVGSIISGETYIFAHEHILENRHVKWSVNDTGGNGLISVDIVALLYLVDSIS